jgi:hypothetical protein
VNYTELETAIQDYAQNSEASFVSHINEFIISAEDRAFEAIQGALYTNFNISTPTSDGTRQYSAPAGAVDIDTMRLNETPSGNIGTGGPMRYLLVKDYDFLWEAYPGVAGAFEKGIPKYYSVRTSTSSAGEPTLVYALAPVPDDIYSIEIQYQGKLSTDSITNGNTPGVTSTTTTWISVVLPDTLLYGALVQGYIYMKGEPDVMALYQKNFDEAILLLKNMTETRQDTDTYKANESGAQ